MNKMEIDCSGTIKFNSEFASLIQHGYKTETRCILNKYDEGHIYRVVYVDRTGGETKSDTYIRILNVRPQAITNLTNANAHSEGFKDKWALIDYLQSIYGKNLNSVIAYKFEILQ